MQYLVEVAEDFEKYAEQHYLAALDEREPAPDILVAAARFIETRGVKGREGRLRELLDADVPRRLRAELDEACIDAIVATTEDPLDTARFLARAGTERRPRATVRCCEEALERLGPEGAEAVLFELGVSHYDGARVRLLARLLQRLTSVAPPEPVGAWSRAGLEERREVVEAWRRAIRAGAERHTNAPDRARIPQ